VANNPSSIKRVRTAARRRAVNQPRRSAAKTLVAKALSVATGSSAGDTTAALAEALSSLDRAAKAGVIHPNAAARRKSRLVLKVNAAVAGETVQTSARVVKTTGKAAAAKAAKARVAASKAAKAKGAQTAAGKARVALSKSTRAETEAAPAPVAVAPAPAAAKKAPAKAAAKSAPKAAAKAAKPAAEKKTTRAKKSEG
jgi:ribosomal protein S20